MDEYKMQKRTEWRDIETAPKCGRPIRISGRCFQTETRYEANAVWAQRKCPALVWGWFPPSDKHDGMGPYDDVRRWRDLRPDEMA